MSNRSPEKWNSGFWPIVGFADWCGELQLPYPGLALAIEKGRAHLIFSHANHFVDAYFKHVQKLMIKHACKGQVVWSLFIVGAHHDERSVVLLTPKLERRRIFEGMNVFVGGALVESDTIRFFQREKLGQGQLGLSAAVAGFRKDRLFDILFELQQAFV